MMTLNSYIFNFKALSPARIFLIKALIFIIGLFTIDQLFIIFKYNNGDIWATIAQKKIERMTEAIFSGKSGLGKDILVMGSSHAQFGFDTDLLSSLTGMSAYNMGYGGGQYTGDQELLLKTYLKDHPKPKIIYYGLDVFDLNSVPNDPSSLITSILDKDFKGQRYHLPDKWKSELPLLFNSYKFRLNILFYIKECMGGGDCSLPYTRIKKNDTLDMQWFSKYEGYEISPTGFVKGYGVLNRDFDRNSELSFNANKQSLVHLKNLARLCREQGIQLIIVQTPEHEICLKNREIYVLFNELMSKFEFDEKTRYLNFDTPSAFPVSRDELFFDCGHLNAQGAQLFTTMLFKRMAISGITRSSDTSVKSPNENPQKSYF